MTKRPDGSKKFEGVKDKIWFNTDYIPIWYESIGDYCINISGHALMGCRDAILEKMALAISSYVLVCIVCKRR